MAPRIETTPLKSNTCFQVIECLNPTFGLDTGWSDHQPYSTNGVSVSTQLNPADTETIAAYSTIEVGCTLVAA